MSHNRLFLSLSLPLSITVHLHSLILPQKKADKENDNPSSLFTVWNTSCDCILVNCLVEQRKNGKIPSNGSWGDSVWKTCANALKDSHVNLGGAPKTGDSCHNRWTAVHNSPFHDLMLQTLIISFLRSRRTIRLCINCRKCQASDGMTLLRLLQHLTVSGRIC